MRMRHSIVLPVNTVHAYVVYCASMACFFGTSMCTRIMLVFYVLESKALVTLGRINLAISNSTVTFSHFFFFAKAQ